MSIVYPTCIFSFFNVLQFSEYRSFTSLVRFIPRYFILFDAIVNGMVFFISPFDSSLLVHKNATDFWLLILYTATLPKSITLIAYAGILGFSLSIVSCCLQIMTVFLLFNLDAFYVCLSVCLSLPLSLISHCCG